MEAILQGRLIRLCHLIKKITILSPIFHIHFFIHRFLIVSYVMVSINWTILHIMSFLSYLYREEDGLYRQVI
jgi:hypothetical protein